MTLTPQQQYEETLNKYRETQDRLNQLLPNSQPTLEDISQMTAEDLQKDKLAQNIKKISDSEHNDFSLVDPNSKNPQDVINQYLEGKIKPSEKPETDGNISLEEYRAKFKQDLEQNNPKLLNQIQKQSFGNVENPYRDSVQGVEIQNALNSQLNEMENRANPNLGIPVPLAPIGKVSNVQQPNQSLDIVKNSLNKNTEELLKKQSSSSNNTNKDRSSNKREGLDPLAQYKQLLKLQEERDLNNQRMLTDAESKRDINAALGMITSGISKAAAGYGGGSVTQLEGDTTAEKMLNQTAQQKIDSIKEQIKNASENEKNVLQRQLTLAQIQKMKEDKEAEAAKLKFSYDKLKSEEAIAFAKGKNVPISADERKIYEENRKTLKEKVGTEPKFKELLKKTDLAIELAKDYSKKNVGGTGILASAYTKLGGGLAPESSELKASLNDLSLENMVSMFSGFSKAIDTEGEREFYQSTQPEIGDDDKILMNKLNRRREHIVQKLQDIQDTKNTYTRTGRFKNPEDTQVTSSAEKSNTYPKQVRKGNQTATISNSQEEQEARQEGWN